MTQRSIVCLGVQDALDLELTKENKQTTVRLGYDASLDSLRV